SGKGAERGRIPQMKSQLLVAQLSILFEQRAAQYGFRRQTLPSRLLHPVPAQIADHLTQQRTLLIEPVRTGLQLASEFVLRKDIKYAGLHDAFLTHCRAPAVGFLPWNQWYDAKAYPKSPSLTPQTIRFSK